MAPSTNHPPPTPDSPPTFLRQFITCAEPQPPSHPSRRRSSRSRSPPPRLARKTRPEVDRPSPDARRTSRGYSSEEIDDTAPPQSSGFDSIQRNMTLSSSLDLPGDAQGHFLPRSMSESFYSIRLTATIERLDKREVLGGCLGVRRPTSSTSGEGRDNSLGGTKTRQRCVLIMPVRLLSSLTDANLSKGRPRAL